MDSMIKEINDNLKAILETIKDNRDNSINTLDNIQNQMDKKVEEAKKYKIQVDASKEKISDLEDENKSLELSLKELNDKYSKMNLVGLIEAGNREIKSKINENIGAINKEKEHIQELTNRARTIKDLLINLKKDKTIKEEKLENIKIVYEYYSERINEVINYAFNHANNLSDYKSVSYSNDEESFINEDTVDDKELENTMVFDEIASIDKNKNFKDEMSFINDEISDKFDSNNEIDDKEKINEEIINSVDLDDNDINSDDNNQVFDNTYEVSNLEHEKDVVDNKKVSHDEEKINEKEIQEDSIFEKDKESDISSNNNYDNNEDKVSDKTDILEIKKDEDKENEDRINKINDLFSSINVPNENVGVVNPSPTVVPNVETKIDNAYKDIFGEELNENDLNKKEPTLTDIFGNPIKKEDLSEEVKTGKKLEDLFSENGLDFNKFREDEKSYLKQIYNEDKFKNIIETLRRNKINLDNIYHAFNIFGEMSANELENMISKLINVGQSVEAIGLVLEKLPKVKKYNLDEAINSYGDYVKNLDITELFMKAKELYKNGGNL